MKRFLHALRLSHTLRCLLFVALCFGLSSAVYLSWLDRLVSTAGADASDWGSMVAGYLFQAAGLGITVLWLRRQPAGNHLRAFLAVLALLITVSVPTLVAGSAAGVMAFGWLMNGLCGAMAGFYLYAVGHQAPENRKSIVFGGGYALATLAVGLLALIGKGRFLHGPYALILYVALSAGLGVFAYRSGLLRISPPEEADPAPAGDIPGGRTTLPTRAVPEPRAVPEARTVLLAGAVVVLISLVKNLGYGFPSADIEAGLIPELSRLPYAAGLIAAGLVQDRNRRNGMLCTLSALILPFLMLGLIGEPVSSTIFWGLDYIFFAFFSVYRAVLFLDLAKQTSRWELAPLGLLAGRIGDAAGTGVHLLLAGQKILLIGVAAARFIPAVFLLFQVHRRVYEPEVEQAKREQEIFDEFCKNHDFSAREKEIFLLLLENNTNPVIAEKLFISGNTVKYHVRNILQKVGCKNRTELQQQYQEILHPNTAPSRSEKPSLHIVS